MNYTEKAYAKLNLSLDVSAKRDDGFHDMTMVMQSISLCDELTVSVNDRGFFFASSNFRFIPSDEKNLAVKAAKVFFAHADMPGAGAEITIEKNIPAGAGMGGGSSDAAAVLRVLNRITGKGFSAAELEEMSCEIGSDVPFCIRGGTQLAKGRGEILSNLPPMPDCRIVVCKPAFSISTPELFRKLDAIKLRMHPDTQGLVSALESGDCGDLCRRMYNVFEDVDDRRMRTVAEIKNRLLDYGASGSIMTGTGSAVFGVYLKDADFDIIVPELKKEYGFAALAGPTGEIII